MHVYVDVCVFGGWLVFILLFDHPLHIEGPYIDTLLSALSDLKGRDLWDKVDRGQLTSCLQPCHHPTHSGII